MRRTSAHHPKTVLVVDDDRGICGVMSVLLQQAGYRVLRALDGEEALNVSSLYAERIDLLIADIAMPGISGPNLARRLKQNRPDLRLLFISGLVSEQNFQGVLGGAYLRKPFLPRVFLEKVRDLLAVPSDHETEDRAKTRSL